MNSIDKNLSDILNTEYSVIEATKENKLPAVIHDESDDQVISDADYARSNLYGLIEKGNETIENISEIAKESMHPRAFEVLGQLMKTQSDNLDKLLKLQKDKKDLLKKQEEVKAAAGINVEQAVFVGSTAELLKRLKNESAE